PEGLLKTTQAHITRIAKRKDDSGFWKQTGNQADLDAVQSHLVDEAVPGRIECFVFFADPIPVKPPQVTRLLEAELLQP
ncbi:MAG: hypothetical protein WBG04_16000, partial [Haloferula sp.]